MRRPRAQPTAIGAVVRRLVGDQEGTPSGRRSGKTLKVFGAFARIGSPIVDRAEAVAFKGGVLTLEVQESVWLTELSLLAPQIRDRINRVLKVGWVKRVRLRLGLPRQRRPRTPLRPLHDTERAQIMGWTCDISNPDVREAVRRAAERSVRRGLSRTGTTPGPAGPRLAPAEPVEEAPALTYGYGHHRPASNRPGPRGRGKTR